jgi:hypothetical protein
MSTATLVRDRIGVWSETHESEDLRPSPSIRVQPEQAGRSDIWRQFREALRHGAELAGFPQPDTVDVGHRPPPNEWSTAITVAPGIIVRADDYEERYAGIDLQGLRARMTPEVFQAFVRYIGSVPGRGNLDVDLISDILE